jgi:putative DNA-invertase from lambdoid prophage Rac
VGEGHVRPPPLPPEELPAFLRPSPLLQRRAKNPPPRRPKRPVLVNGQVVPAPPEGVPRAFGYARVSLDKQQANTSTKNQVEEIRRQFELRYSRTHDLVEIGEEVESAEKFLFRDRPVGRRLWAELRSGDVLIIAKVDRFSRRLVDGLHELKALWSRGVKVLAIDMGGAMIEFDGGLGEMQLTLLLWAAQFERKRITERTTAGQMRRRAELLAAGREWTPSAVRYGEKRIEGGKRVADWHWRYFTRRSLALYAFCTAEFGWSARDRRITHVARSYDLTWWKNFVRDGRQGTRAYVPGYDTIRNWFVKELALQKVERAKGIEHAAVNEPWRADHAAWRAAGAPVKAVAGQLAGLDWVLWTGPGPERADINPRPSGTEARAEVEREASGLVHFSEFVELTTAGVAHAEDSVRGEEVLSGEPGQDRQGQ